MSGTYYFVIVGHNDNPLFEMEFSSSSSREVRMAPEHIDLINGFLFLILI